jgi:AcrR family transcriptional regulator
MPRPYRLKRRAERQQDTRRRIVEAAVSLHRSKGPVRTTLSDVADLAGVQRHTLYRHFPDEKALGLACSGHFIDEHPLPDPASWRAPDGAGRRRIGLTTLYTWFEENAEMVGSVVRDAEVDPLWAEMFALRAGEPLGRIRQALARGLPRNRRTQALLDLALDFYTWRRLAASGLSPALAAEAMAAVLA